MKYFILLFILSSTLSTAAQNGWQDFESSEGQFYVLVPGDMVHKEQYMETAVGKLLYTTYLHQPTGKNPDNLYYSVSFVDYPEHSIHSDSTDFIDAFFHYTIDASVKSVMGDLRYVDHIELEDYPGRLWRVDYKKGTATIKTKAFMVGRRFYQIQVVMHREKSLNTQQDKFFDSFRLDLNP